MSFMITLRILSKEQAKQKLDEISHIALQELKSAVRKEHCQNVD